MVLVCGLVSGPVGDPVGHPVGGPVDGLVGGPVCGLVDGPVCGPFRAVCCPVETRPAPYSGLPASNAWILVGKQACVLLFPNSGDQPGVQYNYILKSQSVTALAADSGFRTVRCAVVLRCCCGAVAVLRTGCGGAAVALRWSGQWSQSVQSMVRFGRLSGPVSGPVLAVPLQCCGRVAVVLR